MYMHVCTKYLSPSKLTLRTNAGFAAKWNPIEERIAKMEPRVAKQKAQGAKVKHWGCQNVSFIQGFPHFFGLHKKTTEFQKNVTPGAKMAPNVRQGPPYTPPRFLNETRMTPPDLQNDRLGIQNAPRDSKLVPK